MAVLPRMQTVARRTTTGRGLARRWTWQRWLGLGLAMLLVLLVLVPLVFYALAMSREQHRAADLAPPSGRLIATAKGPLFVQEKGSAERPPVLLIHGTAAWSELWRETIDHLAGSGFRVIALDLPPFGFSARPADRAYSREHQAARIAALIDALQLRNVLLVGHSFGAGPTVETVLRHPDKIGGLVLIAGALGISSPGGSQPPPALLSTLLDTPALRDPLVATVVTNPLMTAKLLGSMVHRKEAVTPGRVAVLQRPMTLRDSTRDLGAWLAYFVSVDRGAWSMDRSRYASITTPTALIWGKQDTLTPLAQAYDLRQIIPGASLVVLDGVGHIPQIEDPDRLGPALVTALQGLRGKP